HAFLQEGRALADEFLVEIDLVVGFQIHEHEVLALAVEILEVFRLDARLFDALVGAEAVVELAAVDQVLELDLVISRALARLHRHGFHGHPQAAIVLDDHAGPDFVAIDLHWTTFIWMRSRGGGVDVPAGARWVKSGPARCPLTNAGGAW